ncbi:RagB/SusD family nutrient uptake outer membrane protein [Moheibacter sediminis]|nr:RagB/SusD family nutrient uptake outer membrane protein [Moheibacter sediminis]
MKKWFIIPITMISVLTISCEDYLEEKNISGLTADEYYATEEGMEALVNSCYTTMRFWYGKENGMALTEIGTDLFTRGSGMEVPAVAMYNSDLNGANTAVEFYWNRFYAALNTCNAAIGRLPDSPLAEDVKSIREGEARFLRAFYLWHIVETWGGVHLFTEEVTDIQTTAYRSSVEDFYAQIIEDLQIALSQLPATSSQGGRVTKPAAEAFLARIYLFTGQNDLAAVHAKNVINNYGFSLLPNYNALWGTNNTVNSEAVWSVNYTNNLVLNHEMDDYEGNDLTIREGGNNSHLLYIMTYDQLPGMKRDIANGRPFSRFMPTAHLMDLFDETKDARFEGTFQTVWYCNNLANAPAGMALGDTAIYATKYIVPDSESSQHLYTTIDREWTYDANDKPIVRDRFMSIKKFLEPNRQSIAQMSGIRDAYVIRLAEMYLIVAEAEMNTNPGEALQYLNVVRQRAALPGQQAAMMATASDLNIDFILDERAREFAGEQMRFFDLKRTNKLIQRVQQWNPDAAPNIQDFHKVRPIPQSQLDAITNPGDFPQNPGYQ